MAPSRTSKGKQKARNSESDLEDVHASAASVCGPDAPPKVKKPRRAVTRKCPVCDEEIPVRLLGRHAELEAERVDEIVRAIGSSEALDIAEPDDGLTARTRKSAAKARKSMQPGSSTSDSATLEIVDKSLRLVKRHRKQRHAKLRDMTREDDDICGLSGFHSGRGRWAGTSGGTLCPVCMKMVPGDPDVVEAHVDACLAHEARIQEEREREAAAMLHRQERDVDVDTHGDVRVLATDGASLTGLGFAIRDHSQQDVDDDIDVDGEDEGVYGVAQFSEGDVVNPLAYMRNEEEEVDIDDDEHESSPCSSSSSGNGGSGVQTLRDVGAEGKVEVDTSRVQEPRGTIDQAAGTEEYEELDRAIERAKKSGTMRMLVEALERKLSVLESTRLSSSTSLCRICLDPYTEPTISTGCWHTCCRECWLRCLGSTRLCPMCKRITVAADLRRVFL